MAKKLPDHITKLPNGKFRVRYKKNQKYPVPFDKTFDKLEDAVEGKGEYLGKIALKVYTKNTKEDIGFSDFCDYVLDWYRTKARKRSQNTIRSYKKYMNRLRPIFKNINLRDITTSMIEEAIANEQNRQKLGNGAKAGETISGNTLHHEYTTLRMILNKAKRLGFIENNPIVGVEEPEFEEKEIIVPEYKLLDEIEAMIMTAKIRERCQFLLGFFTGMREEEVCGVHLEDFDRDKLVVRVNTVIVQDEDTGEYGEAPPKSKKSIRKIPVPERFFDVLDDYLVYRRDQINFLKHKTNGEYQEIPNLFLNKDGHFYRPIRLSRTWSEFRKTKNLDLTFHGLRHYYITNQMNYNDELSERDVQDIAGHANIRTTYKYVHPSQERINKNATNLFNKFSKETLYKYGKDIITIPISHVATIILGNSKYSKVEELQITLSELSNENIDFFNLSTVMENCKNYLQANYPSLERMEKYKYTNKTAEEIINNISQEFGKEIKIPLNNELVLEM